VKAARVSGEEKRYIRDWYETPYARRPGSLRPFSKASTGSSPERAGA
jgi:hypothetical protein